MTRGRKNPGDTGNWPGARDFARRLLAWFHANQRDLPWRRTRDPWAIWVSEVMCQQTRVAAVLDSYERFMARYPTPGDWAGVDDAELHAAWAGLGYYRRARLLRDGARAVVAEHGGAVPRDAQALGRLPGIGTYTKGAVASIAFNEPLPAIDGNVERVLARHRRYGLPVKAGAGQKQLRAWVAAAQPADEPGAFNQALMELGALICTPRSPRCGACPVAADCAGRNDADRLPVLPARRAPVEVTARLVLVAAGAGVLAAPLPPGEANAGQWEPPGPGLLVDLPAPGQLAAALRARHGAAVQVGEELGRFRHGITHHRITVVVHAGTARRRGRLEVRAPDDPATPWTTAARKAFRTAGLAAQG